MLRINRNYKYVDSLRKYKIYIDNEYSGSINVDETKEFNLNPGKHTIYCKIDWFRIDKLIIEENEDIKSLEVVPSMTGWKILLVIIYLTFLMKRYLWLK